MTAREHPAALRLLAIAILVPFGPRLGGKLHAARALYPRATAREHPAALRLLAIAIHALFAHNAGRMWLLINPHDAALAAVSMANAAAVAVPPPCQQPSMHRARRPQAWPHRTIDARGTAAHPRHGGACDTPAAPPCILPRRCCAAAHRAGRHPCRLPQTAVLTPCKKWHAVQS